MGFESVLFYGFAAILLTGAVAMVTVRNTVYAALCLILCFFTSAALWILLEAEFLGIVLVLVYVGAVMVLFLFVVMLLDVQRLSESGFTRYLPVGLLVAVTVAVEMILVLQRSGFEGERYAGQPAPADYSNTEALGEMLYIHYQYPVEIAAVILLVAIIAAILLTLRKRDEKQQAARSQNIEEQVRVQRADRVRLVKMKSGQ